MYSEDFLVYSEERSDFCIASACFLIRQQHIVQNSTQLSLAAEERQNEMCIYDLIQEAKSCQQTCYSQADAEAFKKSNPY